MPNMSFWDKVDMEMLSATSETFRIEVDRALQQFMSDDSSREYSFKRNLNNLERKHIHQKAASYNLVSRSHGKDPNRIITIYKKDTKSNFESFFVDLAPDSLRELERVLQHCEPEKTPRNVVKLQYTEKVFGKLSLGAPPEVSEARVSPQIKQFQEQLPIFEMREKVIAKIRENQVLIVSSETGSGKTTQIPQYIMDDARKRGEPCRILCTQPRRISAVSVAERVSQERGASLGESVGYHIRLESKLGTNCNLIYCTNGVLIRSLMSGDWVLSSLTHIIIDEVHERDKLSDFLLICLRESLRKGIKIKLILMSATINVSKFYNYFQGAEILAVPGRLFTIEQVFLDEVLELTGYDTVVMEKRNFFNENLVFNENQVPNQQYDDLIMQCFYNSEGEQSWAQLLQCLLSENMPINYQHAENGMTALMAAICQENIEMVEKLCNMGCNPNIKSSAGFTAYSLAEEKHLQDVLIMLNMIKQPFPSREELLAYYYKMFADEEINYDLLIRLICSVHTQFQNGAILVFLPGYDDIMICNDRLIESDLDKNSFRVFFLHGSMNIKEQHDVFKSLGNGVRKIILSTNIAETSLTIDDVVYVIDSGKAKVQTYDSCSGLSSLQTQWISKACVKQRAGRAGRTRAGMCFHLFSKARYESFLDERIPEILRVPLEELCLNTKTLAENYSSIYNFLVLAPDPPSPNTVKTAIENLECLGALDKDETLTPLGEYLSQLTIEPHLGKMLIYSVIFKCLDPVLTIVASLAQKDPFQLPPQANLRSCATEKRKSLTVQTFSDHMVYLKAFIKWQDAVKYRKERQFCREFFISPSTMETILKTRSQLLGQLRAAKFVPSNGNSMVVLNQFSENWPLVKAVISSGLYPKLAFNKNGHFCTRTEKKVLIHNSSPLSKESLGLWLVYDEMVKVRNGHQVRGVTPVTPLTISIMCGIKSTSPLENHLEIDEWLEFEFPTSHIIYLRKCIERIVEKKLFSPTNTLNEKEEVVLNSLANILIIEDKSANLTIPIGIKQKPRFFEINRGFEVVSEQHSNDPRIQASNHSHHSYRNISMLSQNFNSILHVNGGAGGAASSSRDGNGYHYNAHQVQHHSRSYSNHNQQRALAPVAAPIGQHRGGGGAGLLRHPRSLNGMNGIAAEGMMPSTSSHSSPHMQLWLNGNASTFLLLKVKQDNSVRIAYQTNRWVFSPQTEKHVVSLDNGGVNVYMVFSVPKMNCFQGVARFLSLDTSMQKPTANIEWIFKNIVPYRIVSHLRNSLNGNRLVFEGVDGQPIDGAVSTQLLDIFYENLKHGN